MFKSDIWLLLWIGLVAFIAYAAKLKKTETVLGQQTERYNLFFAAVVFLPVFLFTSIGEIRGDIWAYIGSFESLDVSVSDVFKTWWQIDKGPGFLLIEALIKQLVGSDRTSFRIVFGLIQSIPLVLIYRKYSEDYIFSIFLFIASGCYSGWMMNGLRQFVASCIIFAALPLIVKRKLIPSIAIILVAMSVHKAALIMIPIVFLVQLKPWKKITIISFITLAVVLYFYVGHSNWMSEESLRTAKGSNPLRIVIAAIPTIIAFVGRKKIAANNNGIAEILVNMSAITVVLYTISSLTSGIMTGRLPGFTAIYNFVLIPYLSKSVFDEKTSKNIRVFFILFYLAYFIYGMITGTV